MALLRVGVVCDCSMFDNNPRLGFDVPFLARVDVAIELSDIADFSGFFFDDGAVGERIQGMMQVNAITTMQGPLFPKSRVPAWCDARARGNVEGFAKYPVGILEFVNCVDKEACFIRIELPIHLEHVDLARKHLSFKFDSALTGIQVEKPVNAGTCLEYINSHIRKN
ncbi:hypothetical protein AZE42_09563 [Rhizopogon vesiculosus]|uniref:DUF8205 domain-containing protein n=1 Tax=Rhizopogon vesiculosus TaxID=180088 RepID=A0A1J8QF39_9AGAM|nr:hypothetical protein AZE42_09563 [Rhizopogon vesiculosus]